MLYILGLATRTHLRGFFLFNASPFHARGANDGQTGDNRANQERTMGEPVVVGLDEGILANASENSTTEGLKEEDNGRASRYIAICDASLPAGSVS